MRKLSYSKAINEALFQTMEKDERVFIIGVGVNSPWYVGQTTARLYDAYGPMRVVDTPVSENGITGLGVGAAISGLRPVVTHARMDFMYYAMDQICNHAANWNYMFGGRVTVPLTIRGIVNRGGEQAAQHSQALQSIFMHIPGIKVVMPSNAYDAKGMLVAAIMDDNPVLYIDDRWLYDEKCDVPEEVYTASLNKGSVTIEGDDITIVASSYMVKEAEKAAKQLAAENIHVEVIDLRSISPIDSEIILKSIEKTGRLIIADGTWETGGVAAEVAAITVTEGFDLLKTSVKRVTLPDTPAPSSRSLEALYYPDYKKIMEAVRTMP